jgi:molecular chaperone GrpE
VILEKENIEELKTNVEKKKTVKKENKTNKELEKLKNEKELLNDKVLRLNAEIVNIKRRYDSEISRIYKYEGKSIIEELLPIIDNFERAIKLDDSDLTDELSKFLSGFKMIYGNLLNILNNFGIKEVDALHKEFDPFTMNAVLTEEETEFEDNIVLDVMQKGYMYNDLVIRPAMVKVNKR